MIRLKDIGCCGARMFEGGGMIDAGRYFRTALQTAFALVRRCDVSGNVPQTLKTKVHHIAGERADTAAYDYLVGWKVILSMGVDTAK